VFAANSFVDTKSNLSFLGNSINSHWEYLLSRPYTLFGASLYQAWFDSPKLISLFGDTIQDNIYVEEHQNVVRRYVIKEQIETFSNTIKQIVTNDREKAKVILNKGIVLSAKAKEYAQNQTFLEIQEALDFLLNLTTHATVFSYFAYPVAKEINDEELLTLAEKLRSMSYYPLVIEKIINPLARKQFGEDYNYMTISEMIEKKLPNTKDRKDKALSGKRFILSKINGVESVNYFEDITKIIELLEKVELNSYAKGQMAYPGKVVGRVRLVLSNNPNIEFNKGDILVVVTSNPTLMPLIGKCGAIVSDEGGITCHAAIVSRELKKPCIVGTKVATHIFKDGDLVEVNANEGTIKLV